MDHRPHLSCCWPGRRQAAMTLLVALIVVLLAYNLRCCVSISGRNEIISGSDGFYLRLGLNFTAKTNTLRRRQTKSPEVESEVRETSTSLPHNSDVRGSLLTMFPLEAEVKFPSNNNNEDDEEDDDDFDLNSIKNERADGSEEVTATNRPATGRLFHGLAPYLYRKSNFTASRKLPQALIIGVKKGGTRALLEFLRLHPDIRAVGPETHFFDRQFHRGLDWYRRHMPLSLDGQLTMEKTPSYFVTREVPRRVYSMCKNVQLLVVVRDPVTRAISDYTQTLSKRRDVKPFDELAFLNNSTGLVDTKWAAIRIGVYAKHLERWLRYFPRKQIHFVSGERLIKDPAGEMAKVQDFLGLRRLITEHHFYFNETKGFPCLKKSERNASPKCLGRTKGRAHPVINQAAIQRLRDFYRPFNAKFYLMTGVNFGWP